MPLNNQHTQSSQFSQYLIETPMLDFNHSSIQALINDNGWKKLSVDNAIRGIYDYVRNEINFGYNFDDTLSASRVLSDGYGQCNTKGTLLMALLRGVNVPNRIHGFTIFNELQRGAIPNYLFALAPERIVHSWVEVYLDGKWLELEGYIIDSAYLSQVQARFADQCEDFSGYGIATKCLKAPEVQWSGSNTYIQKEGIADDFGVFDQPDDFYAGVGSNLRGIKKYFYRYLIRHLMNLNVRRIRQKGLR